MPSIGEQVAQYTILSSVGTGGMGEVFLAEDNRLGRKAALKFLSEEVSSDSNHLKRFLREARSASALNHPNICTIYEINETQARPFIAMEFIDGETVASMVRRRRRSVRQAIEIACQVAAALVEAHSAGIVHRDIKLANIIVNRRGLVKLLDFGLAKNALAETDSIDQQITGTGTVVGTAAYMSPEQARGLEVDGSTDLWSLGVCLYEMLSGTQPFTRDNIAETFASILAFEPTPLSSLVENLPPDIDRIVNKTLSKSRLDRYRTAAELLADLDQVQKKAELDDAHQALEWTVPPDDPTVSIDLASTKYDAVRVTDNTSQPGKTPPTNLTGSFSNIIGRERELAELTRLVLRPDVRLVTLTGIGGTGKTTLSKALAERLLRDFENGAFFIELSAVTQPEMVLTSIADQLGLKDDGETPVIDNLEQLLSGKQILIVLDNFEQVIDAAFAIGKLTASCERLKLVVTSRERLKLSSEIEFPVKPLTIPTAEIDELESLTSNPAVRLFTERAKSVRPDFQLTSLNARDVAAICLRLDGLPLAIELAAARSKILSPASILSRLENRLVSLLTGGSRDLPERQQTMRNAIAWSYDLLEESEKSIFERLAVFSGGFRIDAAEYVCEGEIDVLDTLESLVDKSLITHKQMSDGELRFKMLEVVRDFASEQLAASGDSMKAHDLHATYYTKIAEESEPMIQSSESAKWLKRLKEDHENIRAVMQWSIMNAPTFAVRLAVAVRNYWLVHGHLSEGFTWLKSALETDAEMTNSVKFKLLSGLGHAARFRGDYENARESYERGLAIGIESNDAHGMAVSHRGLGLVAMHTNDLESAKDNFERGLSLSRELDDKFGVAISLCFLGDLARAKGDDTTARPFFSEAIPLFREIDNKAALADALNNLGAASVNSDRKKAAELFTEALSIAKETANKITLSHSLDGLAAISMFENRLESAAIIAGAAENLRLSVGYKIEAAERRFRDEYIAKLKSEIDDEALKNFYAEGRDLDIERLVALAVGGHEESGLNASN